MRGKRQSEKWPWKQKGRSRALAFLFRFPWEYCCYFCSRIAMSVESSPFSFQILLYDMGLNYFASPNLESDKSPVDPKVHFTYTNRNESIFDSNITLNEQNLWEAYGDIMTNVAFYHFIRFIFQIKIKF